MSDPVADLQRARIRYLSAFVRGEITETELNKTLAMIDRSEKRLETTAARLEVKRVSLADWRQRRVLEAALRQSLEVSDGL